MRRRRARERGDIVVGWLVKLVVSLAIAGVAVFEAGAVIVAHVNADSAANDAAGEAVVAYSHLSDAKGAEQAARAAAEKDGALLIGFMVLEGGTEIEVRVEKDARTILLQHASFTRSWTIVQTTRTEPVPK